MSNLTCSVFASERTKIISISYLLSFLEHTKHITETIKIPFEFYNNVKRISVKVDECSMSDNMILDKSDFIRFIKQQIKYPTG